MLKQLLTIGSLFAGIGGFELGLERTGGFSTEWQCEIDPYCLAVLTKHWPHVTRYTDITKLTDPPYVDVLTGGFPCQDISLAGKGEGIGGARSGLWKEYKRIIGEVQPKYAIIENSSALLSRGLEILLQDLVSLGYDAEWHCIPASFVGAPHQRDRIWIVAYRHGERQQQPSRNHEEGGRRVSDSSETLAYSSSTRLQGHARHGCTEEGRSITTGPVGESCLPQGADTKEWWAIEPNVGRVANGIPNRVDRIKCLGNAVVPQIPQLIGSWILAREANA